ncbi:MAG TPA: Gfo/Idh/MocA family oxidoreductase [Armatimonadota bacterium]|nr:Gfo/Idh/MocA family oxidoreductase [Armatimonadota bacterium]
MSGITRRRFIEDSLLVSAALAGARFPSIARGEEPPAKRVGANDRVRIAVIGVRGRGVDHTHAYAAMPDVDVVALCDVDESVISRAMKEVVSRGKPEPRYYQDIRRLLEDKDIDGVSIATTNHWHALAAIWAMQAGKDVYVEKPVSHNMVEGRRMVEAAHKYRRICQAGTQCRSNPGIQQAMEFLHSGKLGKVTVAHGLCYKPRGSIGKKVDAAAPTSVDYNLWLGPAPERPFNPNRFHYNWHWFWDYGNGDLGNQGIHQMDLARWGLNQKGLPRQARSLGGRFGYEDDGETPNTHLTFLDYGDSQLIFEVRGLKTDALMGAKIGVVFYGSEGTLVIPSYSTAFVYDHDGKEVQRFEGGRDHFRNYIDCIRSRKASDLRGDIEDAHISSALCHLGNISYRLGESQPFNKKTEAFGDDKEAYEVLAQCETHLRANGVPLDGANYRLGRNLRVDRKHERFIGDPEANTYLSREYRKPFVVPDKV